MSRAAQWASFLAGATVVLLVIHFMPAVMRVCRHESPLARWNPWQRRRRRTLLVTALPDAASSLSGSLRAGLGLVPALELLQRETGGPLAEELGLALRERRVGVSLDVALDRLAARVDHDAMTLFVMALRMARATGAGLAEVLERLARTLVTQRTIEGKIRTLTAQGRMQAWVAGALPLFVAAALVWIEPAAMRPLFVSPLGWMTLGIMALLEGAAWVAIRRIVAIQV